MRITLCFIVLLIVCPVGYAQDSTDAVFSIKKRTIEKPEVKPSSFYIYSKGDCYPESKGSTVLVPEPSMMAAWTVDTLLLFSGYVSYVKNDKGKTEVVPAEKSPKPFAKILFEKKDSIVYINRLYEDGSESGPMEFFSLSKKKRYNTYNLLCLMGNGRNCPGHGALQLTGTESITTVAGKTFNCLKVTGDGERFDIFKNTAAGRFATTVTYYLDEKTFLPIRVTEKAVDKKNPYCYDWGLYKAAE